MRLTFLLPADNLSGGVRVATIYAEHLQRLGHEVLIVSHAPDKPSIREMVSAVLHGRWRSLRHRYEPIQGHIANSGVPHRVVDKKAPVRDTDFPDADFVVATWWETAAWMHQLPESKGLKVHLIQGYEIWGDAKQNEAVHRVLRLPNLKIAISHGLKSTLENVLGPLNIHVVPNAVDLAHFHRPPRERHKVPCVGFIYAQDPIKGADVLTAACALARQRIPALEVLSFGSDLPASKTVLPSGTTYFLRPDQSQLPDLYARCDFWLFGSRVDSFGLPILEAMACRTPVIGVPVGAAPDMLPEGGGVLVPAESAQEMADTIVRLFSESEADWRARSDKAYAKVNGYSWGDATQKFLALLVAASVSSEPLRSHDA